MWNCADLIKRCFSPRRRSPPGGGELIWVSTRRQRRPLPLTCPRPRPVDAWPRLQASLRPCPDNQIGFRRWRSLLTFAASQIC